MRVFFRTLKRTVLAALPALLLACDGSAPDAKLVARVNGEAITRAAFDAEVGQVLQRYRAQGQAPGTGIEQRVRESVLRRMVDDLIVVQEARRLGVTLSAEELERHFEEHKRRFGTDEAYQDYLKRTYGTEDAMKSDVGRNLLRERVVEKSIGTIEVGEDEIRRYYEENRPRFAERERVRASRILLPVSAKAGDAEKRRARGEAGSLRAKASAKDADFAALARQWSKAPEAAKGGELGWLARGRVPPALEVVFKLPPGAVSGVLETGAGFEIIKVWEKRPARELALEEVKPSIAGALRARKLNERRSAALQRLKDSAKVEQLFLL